MAKNFTQIKAAIVDWLGLDTTRLPDSVQGDIVNIAMREILRNNELRYGETSDTFVTVASTYDYTYPTGWSKPYSLWYTHPTTDKVVYLTYLSSKAEFDSKFPDVTETDLPTHYTIWGNKIRLGKTPDQVITINRNYYKILADLVTTSNENNAFTDEAWEVLLFNCFELAELYGVEDERIPQWAKRGRKMLDDLVSEHARARSIGTRGQSQEPG